MKYNLISVIMYAIFIELVITTTMHVVHSYIQSTLYARLRVPSSL